MSMFYKYANSSNAHMHEATDGDSLNLTAAAEPIASKLQTESTAEQH